MQSLVYSMGTKATCRKAAVHYAVHSLSRGNLKNFMPRSFTFVCQLYCCYSKHNNNKALRITFNSCETVSTSSMATATVNIDKIIKVTSASSYVYCNTTSKTSPWKTDERSVSSSLDYAFCTTFQIHTTLELVTSVMMTVWYAMAVAGALVYRDSGPAAMALCILIDSAIVLKAGMYRVAQKK